MCICARVCKCVTCAYMHVMRTCVCSADTICTCNVNAILMRMFCTHVYNASHTIPDIKTLSLSHRHTDTQTCKHRTIRLSLSLIAANTPRHARTHTYKHPLLRTNTRAYSHAHHPRHRQTQTLIHTHTHDMDTDRIC